VVVQVIKSNKKKVIDEEVVERRGEHERKLLEAKIKRKIGREERCLS